MATHSERHELRKLYVKATILSRGSQFCLGQADALASALCIIKDPLRFELMSRACLWAKHFCPADNGHCILGCHKCTDEAGNIIRSIKGE